MSCPPAEFFGDAFYLCDESVICAEAFYFGVAGGGPAVDLFKCSVAAAEGSGVFYAVLFCRGIAQDHA